VTENNRGQSSTCHTRLVDSGKLLSWQGSFLIEANILYVMENSAHSKEMDIDHDSLLLASAILLDVNRMITGIHALVAIVMRYVMIGISITDNVMGLSLHESAQLE